MLYKAVLTFESVGEILQCDHSNESYWVVLSCGTVSYAAIGGSHFWVCGWNTKVWPFKWKVLSRIFQCSCRLLLMLSFSSFSQVTVNLVFLPALIIILPSSLTARRRGSFSSNRRHMHQSVRRAWRRRRAASIKRYLRRMHLFQLERSL